MIGMNRLIFLAKPSMIIHEEDMKPSRDAICGLERDEPWRISVRYQIEKFNTLVRLIEQNAPEEEFNLTSIEDVGTYKQSKTQPRTPVIEIPAIVIVGQGRKRCFLGETVYDYSAGSLLVGFYPIPVEMAIIEASPEKPFLVAGIQIKMERIADVLLRMERIDHAATKPVAVEPANTFSILLTDRLLDPFVRLFEALNDPNDAAMLGDTIVDEIYYRLLSGESLATAGRNPEDIKSR